MVRFEPLSPMRSSGERASPGRSPVAIGARHKNAMNVLELTAAIFAGALAAGFLGALAGLGGGIVVIPLSRVARRVLRRSAMDVPPSRPVRANSATRSSCACRADAVAFGTRGLDAKEDEATRVRPVC